MRKNECIGLFAWAWFGMLGGRSRRRWFKGGALQVRASKGKLIANSGGRWSEGGEDQSEGNHSGK